MVDVLLFGFESAGLLVTVAVLLIVVPCATSVLTRTKIVKVTEAPAAKVGLEKVTVVPSKPPVKPYGYEKNKTFVPAGTGSLTTTFCAAIAPLLVSVMV